MIEPTEELHCVEQQKKMHSAGSADRIRPPKGDTFSQITGAFVKLILGFFAQPVVSGNSNRPIFMLPPGSSSAAIRLTAHDIRAFLHLSKRTQAQ